MNRKLVLLYKANAIYTLWHSMDNLFYPFLQFITTQDGTDVWKASGDIEKRQRMARRMANGSANGAANSE